MHILVFSEIDPLYSERNRLHWMVEALATEHQVTLVGMRDYTKTAPSQEMAGIPMHFLNNKGESPARVDAFPWHYYKRLEELVDLDSVDLVFSYNGLRFSAYLAKKMRQVPFVYDLCDDLAALASASSYLPRVVSRMAYEVAARYIRLNCALAARVTVTHPLLAERFRAPREKLLVLSNGYFWKKPTGTPPALPVKNPDDIWIVFVGTLREWVDFKQILQEMASWPAHWHLLIVGEEGRFAQLQAAAKNLPHRDRIHFTGRIAHPWLPALLRQADAGLIIKKPSMMDMAVPLKLLEYASQGVPVVTTQLHLVEDMFGDFVHVVRGSWREAIEEALLDNRSILPQKVAEYTWPHLMGQFLEMLETLRPDR